MNRDQAPRTVFFLIIEGGGGVAGKKYNSVKKL